VLKKKGGFGRKFYAGEFVTQTWALLKFLKAGPRGGGGGGGSSSSSRVVHSAFTYIHRRYVRSYV
jgi:hypothetical protein